MMERPQVDPLDITSENNWNGGDYELEILLGEKDDARVVAAYHACWSAPELQGPYLFKGIPITEQTITAPTLERIQGQASYGVAHIPGCTPLLCGSYVIRLGEEATDTFGFYIPTGTLSNSAAQIGASLYSARIDPTIVRWWEVIDAWMETLGRYIYERVPFRYAQIGMEGPDDDFDIKRGVPVPERRYKGHLLPRDGQLLYFPPTV